MNTLFQNILTASFHGSIVILAVMLLRLALKKAPRKYICLLWLLAGLRLLPEEAWSKTAHAQRRPGGTGAATDQPFPDARRAGRFLPGRSGRPGAGADARSASGHSGPRYHRYQQHPLPRPGNRAGTGYGL